jgi:hypothetical protein
MMSDQITLAEEFADHLTHLTGRVTVGDVLEALAQMGVKLDPDPSGESVVAWNAHRRGERV